MVQRLNRELTESAKSKVVRQAIELDGFAPVALSPEEFAARVRNSYTAFKKLAAAKNIVAD